VADDAYSWVVFAVIGFLTLFSYSLRELVSNFFVSGSVSDVCVLSIWTFRHVRFGPEAKENSTVVPGPAGEDIGTTAGTRQPPQIVEKIVLTSTPFLCVSALGAFVKLQCRRLGSGGNYIVQPRKATGARAEKLAIGTDYHFVLSFVAFPSTQVIVRMDSI
jgi:hypothetical protein